MAIGYPAEYVPSVQHDANKWKVTYMTVDSISVDGGEDEFGAVVAGRADKGELVIGGVDVADVDGGEGAGGSCSSDVVDVLIVGVFCEAGGRMEVVGGVLVDGGGDGGGSEEETSGGGGNDEDDNDNGNGNDEDGGSCWPAGGAEDGSNGVWDGADTGEAMPACKEDPTATALISETNMFPTLNAR